MHSNKGAGFDNRNNAYMVSMCINVLTVDCGEAELAGGGAAGSLK